MTNLEFTNREAASKYYWGLASVKGWENKDYKVVEVESIEKYIKKGDRND